MKRLLVLSALLLFCASAAQALDVMIISDSGLWRTGSAAPEIPDPETDKNKYVDTALVEYLESLGYTVDTSGMAQAYREPGKYKGTNADYQTNSWTLGLDGRLAAIQNADLVILSRFADSGSYDDDRKVWNELEVPLLMQNGHMARGEGHPTLGGSTKWGWTNAGNAKQSATATDMEILDDTHPFVEGFASPVTLFEWSTGSAKSQAQNPIGDYPGAATVVGTYDGVAMLVDIPAGTDFDALCGTTDKYGVAGARRAYLGHWTYDGSAAYSWGMDISADYQALFGQVVAEMIPEPATMALLGIGGLALLRRKR